MSAQAKHDSSIAAPLSAAAHSADALARRRAGVSLAIGAFGIAWSAILVRWSGVPGLVSAFYRLAFAAAVFVPWRLAAPRKSTRSTPAAVRAAIIAGILFGADLAFFNSAVMQTSAANATLIGVNAPIFVAFGAWALNGERPTTRFWVGFVLALAGMVGIVGADVVLHPRLGFGDALALAGAACYGVYLLYVQQGRAGMDTLTFTAWSTGVGAAGLWIVCLVARQPLLDLNVRAWAALVGLALASQVVGQLLVAHALGPRAGDADVDRAVVTGARDGIARVAAAWRADSRGSVDRRAARAERHRRRHAQRVALVTHAVHHRSRSIRAPAVRRAAVNALSSGAVVLASNECALSSW